MPRFARSQRSRGWGTPRRLLIADEDPLARAGLRSALRPPGFEVAAEADDAAEATDAVERIKPDACLIDSDLPGGALDATAAITGGPTAPAVIVLTDELSEATLFEVIQAGATGYLSKRMDPRRLPHAVEAVCRGEAAIPRWLLPPVINRLRVRSRGRTSPALRERGVTLTVREWEVMQRLEAGATTAEVANALQLSPVTVRRHVGRALTKLGVEDRKAGLELLRADRTPQ